MKLICAAPAFTMSRFTERLAVSSTGRVALHAFCLFRRPSHSRWHWSGIVREGKKNITKRIPAIKIYILCVSLCLFSFAWPAQAQTPCPGSEACPGSVAQMICPAPGTMLSGNDVTFTWCNANADYFLDIESIPGAHNIFYALVSFQNFVHLINLPTNGGTIHVTLWTQVHGQWQTPLEYSYAAASSLSPSMEAPMLGTNGQFRFTINGVTPGRTNLVQSSIDLSNWTALSTNVALSNSFQVSDPEATNFNRRFYRVFEIR